MRKIPLTRGYEALVSASDYDQVAHLKWSVVNCGGKLYARHYTGAIPRRVIFMHRLLTNAPKGMLVDHKNGNGLDNRRENIRLCTNSQNGMNQDSPKPNGYKGVTFDKSRGKSPWLARITKDGVMTYIGCFGTALEAAKAYDIAAKKVFGEFAKVNFRVRHLLTSKIA